MSDELATLDETLDADELLVCARTLVRAASENPPGDERAAAAAVRPWLDDLGCQVRAVEPAPGRVSLVGLFDSLRPGPTLAVNGHLDVVPAGPADQWEHPPYGAVVADGVLHGRGSLDMKGPIAAALCAARMLLDSGLPWTGRLVFQLVADEETVGTHGTRALLAAGLLEADGALVAEPTGMRLATAERGASWYVLRTLGRAAHGARPAEGVSAIAAMARLIPAVLGMTWDRTHPLLGGPTVNVGTIRGGDKVNMVPAWCEAEVDRRTIPGETAEQVLDEFQAILDREAAADPSFRAELGGQGFSPASEVDPDAAVVRAAVAALADAGLPAEPVGFGGATDARILNLEAGVPAIVLGPGDLALAHSTAERVPVADLLTAARVYARLYATFLCPELRPG
ncbi:MAG TPA: M20 family metallopeptidase [Actinomycetota bacterium]|nr:M20 family metallopeptidase [Actinomycetota bacterium]